MYLKFKGANLNKNIVYIDTKIDELWNGNSSSEIVGVMAPLSKDSTIQKNLFIKLWNVVCDFTNIRVRDTTDVRS